MAHVQDDQQAKWKELENSLQSKLSLKDAIPSQITSIGGLDISFYKDTAEAVVCFVILNYPQMDTIHSSVRHVTLSCPYIPTYLAFREASHMIQLVHDVHSSHGLRPDILFVDGNGTLHPRLLGLACHVGVATSIPTIGVAKNFLEIKMEALLMKDLKEIGPKLKPSESFPLVGTSGRVFGAALRVHADSINPIFVSPGHLISLESSIEWTKKCSRFRVPEPIRAADHLSREYIRQNPL